MNGPGMLVIGVTGRIGCGKTELCRILADRFGYEVISADVIGHEALRSADGPRGAVIARFGTSILDDSGGIDRARLAEIVFSDPTALADLNEIVHPWLIDRILSRLAALRGAPGVGIVLIDAALLLLWKDSLPLDRIVWVRAPEGKIVERMMARGVGADEIRRRLAGQPSEAEFRRLADRTVANDGGMEQLVKEAEELRLWLESPR